MLKEILIGLGAAVVGWGTGVEVYRRSSSYRKSHHRSTAEIAKAKRQLLKELAAYRVTLNKK